MGLSDAVIETSPATAFVVHHRVDGADALRVQPEVLRVGLRAEELDPATFEQLGAYASSSSDPDEA